MDELQDYENELLCQLLELSGKETSVWRELAEAYRKKYQE